MGGSWLDGWKAVAREIERCKDVNGSTPFYFPGDADVIKARERIGTRVSSSGTILDYIKNNEFLDTVDKLFLASHGASTTPTAMPGRSPPWSTMTNTDPPAGRAHK